MFSLQGTVHLFQMRPVLSYRKKLLLAGIPCRKLSGIYQELPDYGKVFHIDDLETIYNRNTNVPDLRLEVQVWDKNTLRKIVDDNDINMNDTETAFAK